MDIINDGSSKACTSLNQSYCDSIKRISHQKNFDLFSLPQEILLSREQSWNRLFNKYNNKVPNDYEVNMINFDVDMSENDKNIDEDSNDDNDEMEDNFFVKNRTPIRKSPALVQYWVDTGNPPFQLDVNNDSESSLSEEPKSSPLILHKQSEIDGKLDNSTSFLSSVDTAAYILSNTNITTKANTLAIVEGAKKSHSLKVTDNSLLNAPKKCLSPNETSSIHNNNPSIKNIKNCKIIDDCIIETSTGNFKPIIESKLKDDVIEARKSLDRKSCDKSLDELINQNSMKITDVLPTLEQLDKTLNNKKGPGDDSSEIISGEINRHSITGRRFCRKKLYTNRSSPVDLMVSNENYVSRPKKSLKFLHPALETPSSLKRPKSYLRRRSKWAAKKNKRSSEVKNLKEIIEENDIDAVDENKEHMEENVNLKSNSSCDTNVDTDELVVNDDYDKLDNGKKMNDLMALCQKKSLIVRLKKISDIQPLNNEVNAIDNMDNSILSETDDLSMNTSDHKESELLIDSQESDLSTILICQCNNSTISSSFLKRHEHSDGESLQTDINVNMQPIEEQSTQQIKESYQINQNNKNNQLAKNDYESAAKQLTEVFDNDENSSDFIGKFNKTANLNIVCKVQSILSHIDFTVNNDQLSTELHETNHLKKSDNQSSLGIIFSSDEEDDFVKMIREESKACNSKSAVLGNNSEIDAVNNQQIVNNCDESKRVSKFRLISFSSNEEVEQVVPKRTSRRLVAYYNGKLRKPVQKTLHCDNNINNKSRKRNKRKSTLRNREKLNSSFTSDSSNENIAPTKKFKTVSVETPDSIVDNVNHKKGNVDVDHKKENIDVDHRNQPGNLINTEHAPIISSNEDSSSKNKNTLNSKKFIRTIQSKDKQRTNHVTENKHNISDKKNNRTKLNLEITRKCYVSLVKCFNPSKCSIDSGLSSLESLSNKMNDKEPDVEIFCSDNGKSISTMKKQNKGTRVLLKNKSNRSNVKRASSRLIKKAAEKNHNSSSDDSTFENDGNIQTRLRSARNELKSANVSDQNEENFLDSIFPDPLDHSDVSESTLFFKKSVNNLERNNNKNKIVQSPSNHGLRNKSKFRTRMFSDSD